VLRGGVMRAGWILKEGGFGARERDTQRLLKSHSFGTFLGEARKVLMPSRSKIGKSLPLNEKCTSQGAPKKEAPGHIFSPVCIA